MRKMPFVDKPINMLLLINIMAFSLLYFYKLIYDEKLLIVGFVIAIMIAGTYMFIVKKDMGDEYLFLVVAMLSDLGVLMIYRLDQKQGVKQIIWFALGILIFFISYFIYQKFSIWENLIYYYIGTSFVLFLVTLIFGKNIKGANNWLVIGGYSFQPSELIKIIFVFFMAAYFKEPEKLAVKELRVKSVKVKVSSRLVMTAVSYLFMGFLVLQREWGTALLLFVIYFVILYIFENKLNFLILNLIVALCGGVLGYFLLDHIQVRFETWWNPWKDISGKGYQIIQSLFAIGSGGFFGTGIGLGRPDFIPEVHTDFIFSAICEEMGIFGGAAVILLYFILTYRGFKVSIEVKNLFDKAIALGLTVMFGFQTFIIIGGVIKLIPLTGITLPFVSYGGSSMITSFIALGILQAISGKRREWKENESDVSK